VKDDTIIVCGAGGFVGGNLVRFLEEKEYTRIRAIDVKPQDQWFQISDTADNLVLNLESIDNCRRVVDGARWVFNLAANMGGIGFIEGNKRACMLSVLVNTHLLMASEEAEVERFFFSSSACVYNNEKQKDTSSLALRESDAYPALPQDGYGWEKLFSERLCGHYSSESDLITRVARYHNTFGPFGAFVGGREKAPAAICRKIIEAKINGTSEIEIWGTGEQERSFTYIDDCLEGTYQIIQHPDLDFPVNLGSSERVSINTLVDMVEEIAGIKMTRRYLLDAPIGVKGRNSDNSLIKQHLDWEPSIPLAHGLEKTYEWIYNCIKRTS